jgi:hypothetical protein
MKRALLLGLCGALLLPVSAGAQAQGQAPAPVPTTTTVPEETGPPKQEVVSAGTLPEDLLGRWLIVGWIAMKGGDTGKTTTSLWDVTKEDEQVVFREVFRGMPSDINAKVVEANAGDNVWRPTPADIAEIARSWDSLPEHDPKLATLRNELYGKDGFDRDFKNEEQTKDAIWAARQSGNFRRSASPSVKSINVFGAMEAKDGGYAGNYTAATIAAAPFPIPIKLEGKFQMYRVAGPSETAKPGFWSSLFSGCGRK